MTSISTLEQIDFYVNEIMTLRSECFLLCHRIVKEQIEQHVRERIILCKKELEDFRKFSIENKKVKILAGEKLLLEESEKKQPTLNMFIDLLNYYKRTIKNLEDNLNFIKNYNNLTQEETSKP
jgi:hypothetical protein